MVWWFLTRSGEMRAGLGRALATLTALVAPATWAAAQAPSPPPAPGPTLALELNKLETYDKGCRAYMVINNTGDSAYQAVKLELVMFQPDGVIAKRIAIDLAPVKASKKIVKLFDIEGLACDKVANVLLNDVMECKADTGIVPDCLARVTLSSVAGAGFTK
jgi:hypothetical protein